MMFVCRASPSLNGNGLPDDIYIRYQCFRDAADMKAAMMKRQPHKIDIGAVFSCPPKDHLTVSAERFHTVQVRADPGSQAPAACLPSVGRTPSRRVQQPSTLLATR